MAEIAKQITELIGRTPMLQLCNFQEDNNVSANIIAMLEYFNPLGSENAMIEDGIKQGKINKDTVIIEPTSGNTGIGLAGVCAAKKLKLILTMPDTMSVERRKIVTALGAEVVLHGNVYDEACEKAKELAAEHGYTFVHPFDDLEVATGQGSIAMEIVKELPTVDMILVPVGGGGLSTGVSTLAKMLNPKIKVIGVEPAGATCMQESLKTGEVVTLPQVNTIADGTAVKTPGETIFPYLQENLDDIITIEDDELIVAFLDILENHKMLVENSGLLTVAALKHLKPEGKKVVSILSGGNMDIITLASVVQNGLIQRSRIFTVSVLLPDVPGQLNKVSKVIADVQGNVIKLEHNQFVSVNRNSSVELTITMEAFGHDHKKKIIDALRAAGFKPKERTTRGVYQ